MDYLILNDDQEPIFRVESISVAEYVVNELDPKNLSAVPFTAEYVAPLIKIVKDIADDVVVWIGEGGEVEGWQVYKVTEDGKISKPSYVVEMPTKESAHALKTYRESLNPEWDFKIMPRVDRRKIVNGGYREGAGPKSTIKAGLQNAKHRWGYHSTQFIEDMIEDYRFDHDCDESNSQIIRKLLLEAVDGLENGSLEYMTHKDTDSARHTEYAIRVDDNYDSRMRTQKASLQIQTDQQYISDLIYTRLMRVPVRA